MRFLIWEIKVRSEPVNRWLCRMRGHQLIKTTYGSGRVNVWCRRDGCGTYFWTTTTDPRVDAMQNAEG